MDRHLLRDLLLALATATVHSSPTGYDRAEHLRRLKALCDSDLEREWLDFLETHNLRLPDEAQVLIPECGTRPDFLYREQMVAVCVDGPYHRYPDRAQRDIQQAGCLEDRGYSIVRFGAAEDWESRIARLP